MEFKLFHLFACFSHRLVQYSSKLVSWSLEKYGEKDNIVSRLNKLEAAFSMTRKGRCNTDIYKYTQNLP